MGVAAVGELLHIPCNPHLPFINRLIPEDLRFRVCSSVYFNPLADTQAAAEHCVLCVQCTGYANALGCQCAGNVGILGCQCTRDCCILGCECIAYSCIFGS
ncbi:hypothetical protein D3C81_1821830 [compost metagenome]